MTLNEGLNHLQNISGRNAEDSYAVRNLMFEEDYDRNNPNTSQDSLQEWLYQKICMNKCNQKTKELKRNISEYIGEALTKSHSAHSKLQKSRTSSKLHSYNHLKTIKEDKEGKIDNIVKKESQNIRESLDVESPGQDDEADINEKLL